MKWWDIFSAKIALLTTSFPPWIYSSQLRKRNARCGLCAPQIFILLSRFLYDRRQKGAVLNQWRNSQSSIAWLPANSFHPPNEREKYMNMLVARAPALHYFAPSVTAFSHRTAAPIINFFREAFKRKKRKYIGLLPIRGTPPLPPLARIGNFRFFLRLFSRGGWS